jgi:hypothetical protein
MVSCSFGLLVILAFYIHKNCGGCFEDVVLKSESRDHVFPGVFDERYFRNKDFYLQVRPSSSYT